MTRSAKDHALAIIKAGLNLVPVIGGPIASLIGDYVPTSTQAAIDRSTELLAQKLDALKDRIDIDAVNKDDFSELFKSCYLVIVRTNREEKLRASAAILANLLLRPGDPAKSSYEELDHLVRCIDALSIGAISVLGVARTIAATSGQGAQRSFQFHQLRNAFPRIRRISDFEPRERIERVQLGAHSRGYDQDARSQRDANRDNANRRAAS